MGFQDLQELVEPWLDLPIRGKTYRVESVDAKTGIWCQRIVTVAGAAQAGIDLTDAEVASLHLDDDEEQDFNRRLLGAAYDEMLEDKVPWDFVKLAARVVFTWTVRDREAAEELWARGGRPEAPRPTPQDRKAPAKKTAKKSARRA